MKRSNLIFVLSLLLAFLVLNGDTIRNAKIVNMQTVSVGGGGACASNQTTNHWDNFLEGFEIPVSGYESNVWTEVGTTANIQHAYDSSGLSTYKPPGDCNQCWHIAVPNDGTETYAKGDLGAANTIDLDTVQTEVTINFYLETKQPNLAAIEPILALNADGGFGVYTGLQYENDGANVPTIRAAGSSNSPWISIATGQWYTIVLMLDTAQAVDGSSITIWSNGSLVGAPQPFRRGAVDLRFVWLGPHTGLGANQSCTFDVDLVAIKTN